MEDSYLASCQGSANADADPLLIFGVFDGHGGEEVAKVVAEIGREKILRCGECWRRASRGAENRSYGAAGS